MRTIQVFESDGTEVKTPKTLWLRKKAEELNYRLFIYAEIIRQLPKAHNNTMNPL